MARTGKWTLQEDGTWREGCATPRLLREDLRRLPGEIVTRDDEDDSKAHELDPAHVVEAIAYEHGKAEREEGKKDTDDVAVKKLGAAKVGERVPLSQWEIDIVRMRIIQTLVAEYAMDVQAGRCVDVERLRHVWFPSNNVNAYELRDGAEPPNIKRPGHLKNFKLTVDVLNPPESVAEVLRARGVEVRRWSELYEVAKAADEARQHQVTHTIPVPLDFEGAL